MQTKTLFTGKQPHVIKLYDKILAIAPSVGAFTIEYKKTCIHLVNKGAFLGIHPKVKSLDVTVVSDKAVTAKHLIRTEQVSSNRFHLDLRFYEEEDIDEAFIVLLKASYLLKNK